MDTPTPDDTPRKGRSNAILTYETIEEMALGIQRVDLKLDHLSAEVARGNSTHADHEIRIRALELSHARLGGGSSAASFIWQAVWPVAAVLISAMAYFTR